MATILDLLMALNRGELPPLPPPARPVPFPVATPQVGLPMPPGEAPMGAPMAPMPALDEGLINRIAGAEPVAPTFQAPGTLEKIATLLSGLGAGAQGRGPEYAESVRERRDRPQREYQAATERFQTRKLRGIEAAEEKRMREQAAQQRRAEIQSNREFEAWAQRAKITDEDAKMQARQAWELQKIREQERIADERQAVQQKAIDERQRRAFESDLRMKDGAPAAIAKEISEYNVGMRPTLSAAAEKWRGLQAEKARAQIARLERTGTGGGGASDKALKLAEEIETVKDKMIEAEATTDNPALKEQLRTKLNGLFRRASSFPELRFGLQGNKWPWVLVNGQPVRTQAQQPAAPQGQQKDSLGIR